MRESLNGHADTRCPINDIPEINKKSESHDACIFNSDTGVTRNAIQVVVEPQLCQGRYSHVTTQPNNIEAQP